MLDSQQDDAVVASGVRVTGEDPVRFIDDALHGASPGLGAESASEADKDQFRTIQIRVATLYRAVERGGEDCLGEERPCAHRRVVGNQALVSDGGKGRGADDHDRRGGYVERGIGCGAVTQVDGVADTIVQRRKRCSTQDDLVAGVEAMPGKIRWRDRLVK